MGKIYSFEKLRVWQDIRTLVKEIYLVSQKFPSDEKFGLTNQIRRAVVSVSSNIAEGTSRTSFKDQAHFSQIAFSSLMEVLSQLILLNDLGLLDENDFSDMRIKIENIGLQINALRKSQIKQINK